MLDDAVGEAETLKPANSRAIVYAIAGDLYRKFDDKRGRKLFRRSGNEILAVITATAFSKKANR